MSFAIAIASSSLVERDHREHRAEDLLLRDASSVVTPSNTVACTNQPLPSTGGALAAGDQARALALPGLDVAEHVSICSSLTSAPRRVFGSSGSPGGSLLRALGELRDELVVDRSLDQQARAGGAHLALAVEDAGGGAAQRGVEVGVGEDDVRRTCRPARA